MTTPRADSPRAGGAGAEAGGGPQPHRASAEPGGPDPLDELTQRVRAAQAAAERIVAEAAQSASQASDRTDRPPPRGYARRSGSDRASETQALAALLELGVGLVPPELRRALSDLVRELLLALRALIDWYLERLELSRPASVEVEDIPIS